MDLKTFEKIAGITLAVTLVLFIFNYWLMMRITNIASQITDKRIVIASHSGSVNEENLLKNDLQKAQAENSFLDSILPPPDSLIDFPRDVSVWATQNNIDAGFSFVKEFTSTDNEPGYISFILTGSGTLPSILNFIKTIERGRYFIKFNQYDIVSDANKYTLLINGQIFSR